MGKISLFYFIFFLLGLYVFPFGVGGGYSFVSACSGDCTENA